MISLDMTFLASVINFLLLTGLLTVVLYKPIQGFMKRRNEEIRANLAKAEEQRALALRLKEEYEAKVASIGKEAHDALEAAIREGEQAREEIITKAQEEAKRIIERAQAEALRERDRILGELGDELVTACVGAVAKVIGMSLDVGLQKRLLQESIERALTIKVATGHGV